MKAVLETLYKWCGALHRYIQRGEWNRTFTSPVQMEFVGGYVVITRKQAQRLFKETISYTGSGSSVQTETLGATILFQIRKIESVGCRSLIVDGEVLV